MLYIGIKNPSESIVCSIHSNSREVFKGVCVGVLSRNQPINMFILPFLQGAEEDLLGSTLSTVLTLSDALG